MTGGKKDRDSEETGRPSRPARTGPGVQIVPYEPRYRDDTLAFLAKWNPEHPELGDGALFEWQQGRRWLALFQGRITGHIAQIPHTLKAGGGTVELGWAATLVLDTSNPLIQTFAGTALLDEVTRKSALTFGAVGIVPEIAATHRKRGYVVYDDAVAMYARFFRPAPALKYYNKPAVLSFPVRLVNVLFPTRRRAGDQNEIQRIDRFDPVWDATWDRLLAERNDVYTERTAAFLNHKITQPHKEYVCCIHTGEKGRSPAGYIIFRRAAHRTRDLRLLKVVDLVGTDSARTALLAQAVIAARRAGVDGIVGLNAVGDRRIFSRCGLWLRRPFPVVLTGGYGGRMQVTFFDSDLDNLW
ncbi:MAG TPA: hypothetical protein VM118_12540 [Acidobacteriota bacterium]|nr:hypothetical protein [Acidobacteriota bacterium]